jgi:subtilase family serine protease
MGPVEDSFKLENVTLMFKRMESQQAGLTALLDELQSPSSPNFHQWLTPEQFADRFGLSPIDVDRVVAWLQAQGFTVTQRARSRNWVSFTGTAAQVQAAFQTEIHYYHVNREKYYANATEPSVPSALAGVILGLHALDNYPLKPRGVFRQVKAEPKPDFTSNITGNTFVAPADFAILYDVNSLYAAGIDGTGQSIAVMGQTDLYSNGSEAASDIATFRSVSGLPANAPQVILIPGASDPGVVSTDIAEASLDVEWSGAVAKNATIIFVNGGSNGVFNAFQYAVDNQTAPVISVSYGACEADWTAADLNFYPQLAQEANTQGQTIVAAAGDAGAAECDSSTSLVMVATHGLSVDAPASFPYVTGMGGTEFNEGIGAYWSPAPNGQDVSPSALSYIPEKVWNDTSSSNGLLAGGGGASTFFAKPTWQTGPGVPNDNARDVPDLSLNSSSIHDSLLTCAQGSCVNGYRDSEQDLKVAGGTSAAAPTFAGIVALINQQMNSPKGQGNVNYILYPMAASAPAAFHDITTGNNIVPCEVVSTDTGCPASGEMGYSAGPGYDQASGLGSIDAFNLVTAWNSSGTGNLPAPMLTAPTHGALSVAVPPTFTWTAVAGNAGYRIMIAATPADLPANPATSTCNACTLVDTTSTNSNSYTPAASVLAGNAAYYWQVQALEPSNTGVAAWSPPFVFYTGVPDFSLSASPSTLTLTAGGSGTSTLTLAPINNNLNFSSNTTLTCSASSTLVGVTCSVAALGGNNTATVTISASVSASTFPALHQNRPFQEWPVGALATACLLLMGLITLRRRDSQSSPWNPCLRPVALVVTLACLLLMMLSCGGGGGGGGGGGSTPPSESGTVTVQAVGPSTTHTTSISVTVD